MIDWLRRAPREVPALEVAGQTLPVVLRRTAAAKRMTLRLAPDGSEVRLTMPRWGRSADGLEFARSKTDWLAAQLARLPRPIELRDGAALRFLGEETILRHDPARPRRVRFADGQLHVGGPIEALERRLVRWLEGEARRLFTADLEYYCARAERPVPRLMLSRARRRWGSCARDGTLRINWRLVMAPEGVRRSVVAHEVAHLVHFDHSPHFHALLAQLYEGDIRHANRWLKAEGRSLYQPFG